MSDVREMLRGKLLYKTKKGSSQYKLRTVVVYCGNGKKQSAKIEILSDYEERSKPKSKTFELVSAKIDSFTIPSQASSQLSPRNSAMLSVSPKTLQQGGGTSGWLHGFKVTCPSQNDTVEFRCESENTRLCWIKLLGLLIMFPYSRIPEEPRGNPLKDKCKPNVKLAKPADSLWMVYILPEEVGSVCNILGVHFLALRSGVPHGSLDIYYPADLTTPVVSWDSDKMRRTGKTGNLVFVEIGRRCTGGPGLVWMYSASLEEAQVLRETLHKFLFHGDGRAVGKVQPPQPSVAIYDTPRPATDTPPRHSASFVRRDSNSGYRSVPSQSRISESDSGHPPSPASSSASPNSVAPSCSSHYDVPPPLHLDKHPTRATSMQRQLSAPCDIQNGRHQSAFCSPRSHSSVPLAIQGVGGSVGRTSRPHSLLSNDSVIEEDSIDLDHSPSSIMSPCSEEKPHFDDDGLALGQMDPDQQGGGYVYSIPTPQRSYTSPSISNTERVLLPGRCHTTTTCQRSEYEVMSRQRDLVFPERHAPFHGSNGSSDENSYVFMRSRGNGLVASGATALTKDRNKQPLLSSGGAQYEEIPPLSPITEMKERETRRSVYENHPLPPDVLNAPQTVYKTPYENVPGSGVTIVDHHQQQQQQHRSRSGSMRADQYENVLPNGEQATALPGELQRRTSFKRRDKENVVFSARGGSISNGESKPVNGLHYAQLGTMPSGGKQNGFVIPPPNGITYSSIQGTSESGQK